MPSTSSETARQAILGLARQHLLENPRPAFVPGESYVPVSGKVIEEDDLVALLDASLDLWLTAGRYAERFERAFAKKVGVRKSLLTNSGSSANLLAFSALTSPKLESEAIRPGSEVITVAAGFPTTVAPIVQNHCIPVFVDVDLDTHNIDVSHLEAALSPKTRAIMVAIRSTSKPSRRSRARTTSTSSRTAVTRSERRLTGDGSERSETSPR
jgi:CDP-6-deoxy-D-xylo-4-hexulose-3-dehydrase